MYIYHVILISNPIWTFLITFQHTLTSLKFFIKSLQDSFSQPGIYCSRHNQSPKIMVLPLQHLLFCVSFSRIVSTILLIMALFSSCLLFFLLGVVWFPWYLVVLLLVYLAPKVSQGFIFVRRLSEAMNETIFWFALRAINVLFSVLASALSCLGVIIRWGVLSSIIVAVNITVVIFLGRFFIRRFYYTFANRLCGLRTLKHINIILKENRFAIKSLNMGLFRPAIGYYI